LLHVIESTADRENGAQLVFKTNVKVHTDRSEMHGRD
jgi:hypothetical protein